MLYLSHYIGTSRSAGNGTREGSGNCLSNGHTHAFGNTLEHLVWENLGVRERGRASDPPFDHATGKGWVAPHRGLYDDALRVKRNEAELCLHDPLGGGFSPPAVKALHKRAKKARVRDRTNYTCRNKTSFAAFHGQRVSLNVVKGEGEIVATAVSREKANQLLRDMTPPGA